MPTQRAEMKYGAADGTAPTDRKANVTAAGDCDGQPQSYCRHGKRRITISSPPCEQPHNCRLNLLTTNLALGLLRALHATGIHSLYKC